MITVKLTTDKGYSWVTQCNGPIEKVCAYFLGKNFDVGAYPQESIQKVVSCENNGKVYRLAYVAGDTCPTDGCSGKLSFEQGSPASYDEPGTNDCIFCNDCGLEVKIDYKRMHLNKLIDKTIERLQDVCQKENSYEYGLPIDEENLGKIKNILKHLTIEANSLKVTT